MPHYLRMLTYASQPDGDWGPANDANRVGRYAAKVDESMTIDCETVFRVRF